MADVAKLAGVSVATVSLVLNHTGRRISDRTQQRVWQAAHELGYIRDATARTLRMGKSHSIGFISSEGESDAAITEAMYANHNLENQRADRWYPQFHIAPAAGWMNDPNGVCYFKGRYHVFYQHYPYAPHWGPMHWGHVSSPNLVHWQRHPIALAPSNIPEGGTEPNNGEITQDTGGVWSGCAVVDDDELVVFYTGNQWVNGRDDADGKIQTQCLATSKDGITFQKRGAVIAPPEGVEDFRDPKVWRMGNTWYLVVAASVKNRGEVWLYTSKNLKHWEFDRVLFTAPDRNVYMVECPDFFPLGDQWVLLYGPMTHAKPQGYSGRNGHNTGYVVGRWQPGSDFEVTSKYAQYDLGHNFYAPQTMQAPDGRRILFAWMGGFDRPLASVADHWSGQQCTPRELTLAANGELCARPVKEIEGLHGPQLARIDADTLGPNETRVLCADLQAGEVNVEVDLTATSSEQVALLVHATEQSCAVVGYDSLSERIYLDRGLAVPSERGYRSMPYNGGDHLQLRVLVDKGSLEVFANGCSTSLTSLNFPQGKGARQVALASVEGSIAVTSASVHRFAPAVQ